MDLENPQGPVSLRTVLRLWWPLAASWLLMGFELPLVSAVMARLSQPTRSLAAYGGVVMPLSLLIESPIIMLLAASTALSRDEASYRLMRRVMLAAGGALTVLHGLVAFTPIYSWLAAGVLGAPREILEPGRLGLRIMLPWTLAIAYRRFQQGMLIRFGHSGAVGIGTTVRLTAEALVLAAGFAWGRAPGIVVGTSALIAGVAGEAAYAGLRARAVRRGPLRDASAADVRLTYGSFVRFYLPLAVTPLLMFLALPMVSAAMSRMPRALESLAVWPVLNGLVFTVRSVGFGLNEVVVSLLDRPGALSALRRFAIGLAAVLSVVILAAAATPIGPWWFGRVSALPSTLAALGVAGLWIAVAMPALTVLQNGYQGAIVHSQRTRGVTESMAFYLGTIAALLAIGVAWGGATGLLVAQGSMVAGTVVQVAWLRFRAQDALRAARAREPAGGPGPPALELPV